MQGKDVRVVTTTPSGRADCAEPLTALLEQQGVMIKSVSLEYIGNILTVKILRSDDVLKEASVRLPIPTHAVVNYATGLMEMLDSENKVMFVLNPPTMFSTSCGSSANPRPATA